MDTHILTAERRRITEEFRARLTCLGNLRTQLSDALTDEARQYLYVAVDEEMALCRELGDELLQLDASIQLVQRREVAAHEAQRLSITVQNAAQPPERVRRSEVVYSARVGQPTPTSGEQRGQVRP